MCRIYVKRAEYQRYDALYQAFRTSIPGADVVWDRRAHERRRQPIAATVDRRFSERRNTAPESWHALGFVVTASPVSGRRVAATPAAQRTASPPRLLTRGLVEPSVAELKSAFVRLAENLVGEIVQRLKTPPGAGPHSMVPTTLRSAPQPAGSAPQPPAAVENNWKLAWPPHAENN